MTVDSSDPETSLLADVLSPKRARPERRPKTKLRRFRQDAAIGAGCGQCGAGPIDIAWKNTREFGLICPPCANRYRDARRSRVNHRDTEGEKQIEIRGKLDEARSLLVQACWLAESIDAYAVEGEILTVIAGLESVSGSHRRFGNERWFPADDKIS